MEKPSLTKTVRRTIGRHGMLAPGQKVLAAVSGGPDSVAMLHVLAELAPELGISLAVGHLDHGFRPESAREAAFVAETADRLGLPCITEKSDVRQRLEEYPGNKQAAAREARYEFLGRVADRLGSDRIAVGHTADDQAETYIMRELRGSGAQGLSAIPPVRGRIIRPLIEAGREVVLEYLESRGIPHVTDPTNLQPVYLRNKVRIELMPLLKRHNPRVVEAFCRSADILREEEEFLSAYTGDLFQGLLVESSVWLCCLDLRAFTGLPTAIKRRTLRLAVGRVKGDLLSIGYGHIIDAVRELGDWETGRGLDLPGGVRVEKSYDSLLVYRAEAMPGEFSYRLAVPGRVEVKEAGTVVEAKCLAEGEARPAEDAGTGLFDMDRLSGPLEVRSRRPGDFFHPVGMEGRKKLKEYFIDLKLPRFERARTPVLACGGQVIWVMGLRQDKRFAATTDVKRVLLVSFKSAP